MDSWSRDREVEKPKPIKLRAATAATHLIDLREALLIISGCSTLNRSQAWLGDAIDVLKIVAGEKKV